jgi:hypothetical protein
MRETKVWFGVLLMVLSSAVFVNNANALPKNNLLKQPALKTSSAAPKAAIVVSKAAILKKYENAVHLSDKELYVVLKAVGFEGYSLKQAWAVAKKESNGRPMAFNGNAKTGDSSYGIFQINMIGQLGPDRREKFNLRSNSDLLNPVVNAKIAYHMSDGGKNWTAWKGMTTRTKEWMSKFPYKI